MLVTTEGMGAVAKAALCRVETVDLHAQYKTDTL